MYTSFRIHLQQRNDCQVLLDDLIYDHVKHHLYVGAVYGCGEVVVHRLVRIAVACREHGGDVMGCGVHISICSWMGRKEK